MKNLKTLTSKLYPQWSLAEPDGPPPPRIAWVQQRPLTFVGGWEPLSFRRRSGYAWTDEEEYLKEHEFSEAALDRYVKLGCTSIVIPFTKGPGLRPPEAEFQFYKTIIRHAHDRGLHVATYIRIDNVIADLMADDHPDLHEWFARGMHGHTPVYHPQQNFRKRVCFNHPAVVAALEATFRSAVKELRADMLSLDGYSVTNVPYSVCRCVRCVKGYRDWLKAKYPDPKEHERLFGVIRFDRAEMPEFTPNAPLASVVNSPEIRAWYEHLWDKNLAFTRHVRRFVRRLSDDVAISVNPIWTHTFHVSRFYASHVESLLPWVDAIWTEDQLHASAQNGKTHVHHSLFKTAREHNIPVGCYHHETDDAKVRASLALVTATNGGNPSCLGFTFRYLPHYRLGEEIKRGYAHWAQRNWRLLGNTRPDAEIALLRHQPSLAWNGLAPWHGVWAMTQLLSRMPVPWRMFDRLDAKLLHQIKTLIVPDAESMSDTELLLLKKWVEDGGRLFITRRTATHDEHRRRRPRHPILDWVASWRVFNDRLGPLDWYRWMNDDSISMAEPGGAEKRARDGSHVLRPSITSLGRGRLGLWPTLSVPFNHSATLDIIPSQDCVPPNDAEAIRRFLHQLHGEFEMQITSKNDMLIETATQPIHGARLIHIVRLDTARRSETATIRIRDPLPRGVRLHSPDTVMPRLVVKGKTITLEKLQCYAVIEIPQLRET